jgi:GH15 family glucan-1,4-alpha-glucosidase
VSVAAHAVDWLVERSLEVIRAGQHESGAYVASPDFGVYGYAWLRDGSFVADAMSRAGERESAEAFFDWAARIVLEGRGFHARYDVDGSDDVSGVWPLRQLDGWGLWLWAVAEHCGRHDVDRTRWSEAAERTADYLEREWRLPSVDWWEEREGLHAATLACVEAGLGAWGIEAVDVEVAEDRLDASLLCLAWPFGRPDGIVDRVRNGLLSPGGGVHRHLDDVFYGGGEWLLLTAMLGLAELEEGDEEAARTRLEWVAAHATPDGGLPEQSQDHLLHPEAWQGWVDKWGPPPSPLLWSHAMFLDLALALGEGA